MVVVAPAATAATTNSRIQHQKMNSQQTNYELVWELGLVV